MKKSTKLFSMLLTLVMVFSTFGTFSVSAAWDDDALTPDVLDRHQQFMQIENGKLVAYTGTSSRIITIPAGVSEIGEGAFKNHPEIHEVWMHTGVSKIGKEAFKGCINLERVVGNGVAIIGDSAFEDCAKLYDYMYFIGDDVFTKPTSFSIGRAAFKNCVNLRSFSSSIPNVELKAETFANCPKLNIVWFITDATKIDPATFSTITNNGKTVTRSSNPVIYSQVGTVAEAFAKKNSFQFSKEQPNSKSILTILKEESAVPLRPFPIFTHKKLNPRPNPSIPHTKYITERTEGKINSYDVGGYAYCVLRDVAAECNKLDTTKFNIEYMPEKKAINIVFGANYVANGSEYQEYDKYAYIPNTSVTKMPLYFNGHASNLFAYNIGGRACVILKDFLQEMNSPYEINVSIGNDGYAAGTAWLNLDEDAFNEVKQKKS